MLAVASLDADDAADGVLEGRTEAVNMLVFVMRAEKLWELFCFPSKK